MKKHNFKKLEVGKCYLTANNQVVKIIADISKEDISVGDKKYPYIGIFLDSNPWSRNSFSFSSTGKCQSNIGIDLVAINDKSKLNKIYITKDGKTVYLAADLSHIYPESEYPLFGFIVGGNNIYSASLFWTLEGKSNSSSKFDISL